jgi:peptidoglycan hydrolase-like protein with peptidoglycan-binding domain
VAAGLALLLVLAGCSEDPAAPMPQAAPAGAESSTTTTATATTATTAATTTTATTPATTPPVAGPVPPPQPPPPPADGRLVPGMQGEAVRALQERLVALRYDPGKVDGRYGGGLTSAVMAFQKVNGLPRNGRATPDVLAAIAAATDPAPMLPDGGATRVEVDFKRQVLFLWRDGALLRILPVSTGNGKKYCAEGRCGVAVTPSGSYRVERRQAGKRKSYLGLLYDPLYFKGGYAIHGSPSVPAAPASHGCVRIPLHVSRWFYDNVPDRTPVYLVGGRHPATPLPPEPPPPVPPPAPTGTPA